MNLNNAITFAKWLEVIREAYLDYLDQGNPRQQVPGNLSGDWDEGNYVRSSKLASHCAKRDAAEHKELIPKPVLTLQDKIKFDDAVRRAESICEAVIWGLTQQNSIQHVKPVAEYRILSTEAYEFYPLASTIDLFIETDKMVCPIEIKSTGANKYWGPTSGISSTNFKQVVGQMINLQETLDCNYGFIYTTYSADSNPAHKVWIVEYDEDEKTFYLLDSEGNHVRTDDDTWPTISSKIGITNAEYLGNMHKYLLWRKAADQLTSDSFLHLTPEDHLDPFKSWQCGKTKKPELNKNGTVKANTGIIRDLCPLFKYCHKQRLVDDGYIVNETVELPNELPLYLVDGEIRFTGVQHGIET